MGAIQNSFNQLLGISALATGTVGRELGKLNAKKEEISTEIKDVTDEALAKQEQYDTAKEELGKKNPVGRPSKARQQALAKYKETVDAWEKQKKSFKERLDILKTKQDLAEYNLKYGFFGERQLEKDRFKEFKEKRGKE